MTGVLEDPGRKYSRSGIWPDCKRRHSPADGQGGMEYSGVFELCSAWDFDRAQPACGNQTKTSHGCLYLGDTCVSVYRNG